MKGHETLERVKLTCDEKAKQFQSLMEGQWIDAMRIEKAHCVAVVWKMFFDFQIELMKAEAEADPAPDRVVDDAFAGAFLTEMEKVYEGKFPPKPDIDRMEAAAVDAGYIKDVRDLPTFYEARDDFEDFIPNTPVSVRTTNHYFYPQDISDAKEGDIWHDLDGRPHFIRNRGWIEARGFVPKCAEGQEIECYTVEGKYSEVSFPIAHGAFIKSHTFPLNVIACFKLV